MNRYCFDKDQPYAVSILLRVPDLLRKGIDIHLILSLESKRTIADPLAAFELLPRGSDRFSAGNHIQPTNVLVFGA